MPPERGASETRFPNVAKTMAQMNQKGMVWDYFWLAQLGRCFLQSAKKFRPRVLEHNMFGEKVNEHELD